MLDGAQPGSQTKAQQRSALLSLTAHALAIGALLFLLRPHGPQLSPLLMPGTARGTQVMLSYELPGAPPAATVPHPAHAQGTAKPAPLQSPQQKKQQQPPAPPANQPSGDDSQGALGDGDISIALVQFHPRPQPDLSTLAPGTRGDIVLDAVIDTQGRIAHLTISKSLGPQVDSQVLATVQQWTFTPAMRNGTPIVSEQELLFHYERSRNG